MQNAQHSASSTSPVVSLFPSCPALTLQVWIGVWDQSKTAAEEGYIVRRVQKTIVHHRYAEDGSYDVALLYLSRGVFNVPLPKMPSALGGSSCWLPAC